MTETLKIDAHVHVFTTDMPLVDNPRHAPKYSFTYDELMTALAEHADEPRPASPSPIKESQ